MKIKNKFKFAFLSVLSFITVFFSSSKINYQLSLTEVKIQIKETNSINENKRDINNNSNNDNRKKLLYNSSHQEQFDLVNYSKEARIANINKFKNEDEKINVGILEVGDEKGHRNALINAKDIDYFDNTIYKIDVYNNWRWKTGYSEHATKVASIAGGYEGVNPNINLYGQWFDDDDDFEDEIRYFKSKNVKVINMSFGLKYHDNIDLKYNLNSAKLDKVAQENPEIIFVASAGNDGDESIHKLNNWALANNILVVGSTNNGKNRAYYSSYDSDTDRQITLLAPGLYYKNGIPFNGTSFAAPFITGIISLTLQKYPKIYEKGKNNIIAISAISTATKNRNNNILINFDGAGIFDYNKLDQAFSNLYYHTKENKLKDYLIKEIILKENQTIKLSLSWEANVTTKIKDRPGPPVHSVGFNTALILNNKPNNNVFPPIKTWRRTMQTKIENFDLFLLDENNNIVQKSDSLNRNIELIEWKVKKTGKYKIKVIGPLEKQDFALSYTLD